MENAKYISAIAYRILQEMLALRTSSSPMKVVYTQIPWNQNQELPKLPYPNLTY